MLTLAAGTLSPAVGAAASTRLPAARQPQVFGVRLVDVPVSEAGNPRGLRYIIDYLRTGTVIHRRILIMNQESHRARFTVYPGAASIAGGMFTGYAGATGNELTGWITVRHRALTLAPGASAMDTITIKVPAGATRGEHYAIIWVQQAAQSHAASGFGLTEITRVGIRVYLAVGKGGVPPTVFAITSVTTRQSASGQRSIVAHADNTGGRAVDLGGTVRLSDGPGNSSAGPYPAQRIVTLAPGQTGDMTFVLPKSLPGGSWRATINLVSGITTCTATVAISFPAIAAAQPGLSGTAWAAIALGAFLLVLAAAVVMVRYALRRRTMTT